MIGKQPIYIRLSILAALLFLFAIALIPFLWAITTSVKTEAEIHKWPPTLFPSPWTWEHYAELFRTLNFVQVILNSLIVTILVTVISLFLNALGGYTFAKFKFPFRNTLFVLLLLTMMVPGQITMIPVFLLLKTFGFLNSYSGLVVPGAVSVFGIFLMRQYIQGIPNAYIESARIDGCGEFRIFFTIILPLCGPMLAALGIFTITAVWSDFMMPLIIIHDESLYTLPLALANLNGQHTARWGLLMAGAIIAILPILILFLILQRRFIDGMTMVGLKG